jgi:hypothetical protein
MSSDNEPDYLGLTDAGAQRAQLGPALVIPHRMGNRELAATEYAFRMEGIPPLMFLAVDETTGEDIWEPPTGRERPESEKWRRLMSWPEGTTPTIQQAEEWRTYQRALAKAKWWKAIGDAVEQDRADAGQPPPPAR